MALKTVEPGRIISPTAESLKSKTVLSTQKVDNSENEISDKVTWNTFLISRFLPWQDTSSYGLAALRLFEFIWLLFSQNWGTISTFQNLVSEGQIWFQAVNFSHDATQYTLKHSFAVEIWKLKMYFRWIYRKFEFQHYHLSVHIKPFLFSKFLLWVRLSDPVLLISGPFFLI